MEGIAPDTHDEQEILDPTAGEDQVDREAEDPDYVPSGLDRLVADDLEDDEDASDPSDDLDVDDEDDEDDLDVEPSEKGGLG